ncbi:calpain-13-like [Pelodytes ibericus]
MNSSVVKLPPTSHEYNMVGSIKNARKYKNQDFDALREYHKRKNLLFEDETFPANLNTIGPKLQEQFKSRVIEWRRPKKTERPHLFVDGITLFDIIQQEIGNCWVLSVLGAITQNEDLLKNIIPRNQDYDKNYAGIFHFQFWSFGEWVDVVIDDRLPFVNGNYMSVKPSTGNEFWPCLVEKAYAKLMGSYQYLHFGHPRDAFVNFTGGVALEFKLQGGILQSDLFHMVNYASSGTLMTCVTKKKDGTERNRSLSFPILYRHQNTRRGSAPVSNIPENIHLGDGLVERHAYSIVGTNQVHFRNEVVNLIRIWNPWGYGEWIGPWSDYCPNWKEVSKEEMNKMHRLQEDGIFWMSWESFTERFSKVVMCSRTPDYLDWDHQPKQWHRRMFWGTWCRGIEKGDNAKKDLIFQNPQYMFKVNDCDVVKKGYNVVLSLMQHHTNRQKFNADWPAIDVQIQKVDDKFYDTKEKLPSSLLRKEILSGVDKDPFNKRDFTLALNLSAGIYVVIPVVTRTHLEFSFLMQIFLKSKDCAIQLGSSQIPEVQNPRPLQANYVRQDKEVIEKEFQRYASQGNMMNVRDLQRFLNEVVLKGLDVGKQRIDQLINLYGNSEQMLPFVDYLLCMIRLKASSIGTTDDVNCKLHFTMTTMKSELLLAEAVQTDVCYIMKTLPQVTDLGLYSYYSDVNVGYASMS